jgi:hypothetical protein
MMMMMMMIIIIIIIIIKPLTEVHTWAHPYTYKTNSCNEEEALTIPKSTANMHVQFHLPLLSGTLPENSNTNV